MSDLGNKFVCYKCNTKFYDLKKPDPVCPKCGADQRESPSSRPRPSGRRQRPLPPTRAGSPSRRAKKKRRAPRMRKMRTRKRRTTTPDLAGMKQGPTLVSACAALHVAVMVVSLGSCKPKPNSPDNCGGTVLFRPSQRGDRPDIRSVPATMHLRRKELVTTPDYTAARRCNGRFSNGRSSIRRRSCRAIRMTHRCLLRTIRPGYAPWCLWPPAPGSIDLRHSPPRRRPNRPVRRRPTLAPVASARPCRIFPSTWA